MKRILMVTACAIACLLAGQASATQWSITKLDGYVLPPVKSDGLAEVYGSKADGTVLGAACDANAQCGAAYQRNGVVTPLAPLTPMVEYLNFGNNLRSFTGAIDINTSGVAAGFIANVEGRVGDLLPSPAMFKDGVVTQLVVGKGISGEAVAINESGQVAGWMTYGFVERNGDEVALLMISTTAFSFLDGVMTALQTVNNSDVNSGQWGWGSRASDINDWGQIVGSQGTAPATLWRSATSAPLDLNSLPEVQAAGWKLRSADTIDNQGRIIGQGSNGVYLLTPVPEPAAAVLLLAGLLAVSARVRRAHIG